LSHKINYKKINIMSVRTTADDALENAREHILDAYKSLLVVINPDTWGSDCYSVEFNKKIMDAMNQLNELRKL